MIRNKGTKIDNILNSAIKFYINKDEVEEDTNEDMDVEDQTTLVIIMIQQKWKLK